MPTEAVDTGLSDQELFDQANADEAPADEAVVEAPAAEPEQQEQPRDEQGKFAAKVADEPEKPVVAEAAEKPVVDDNAPQVPSWRVREINEEKRRIAEENERMKAELAQLRQAPRQPVEQPKPAEKPARPDPLLDPDGYAAAIRQELREEALNERREESLLRAREANQAEFDEAYAAAQKAVDPALKARMQATRDPGKTLLEWHREQKTRAEVGNDLTAYKQRLREEAMKDPEFRKAAMEAWRTEAQQPTGGKAPPVNLPPSLTRATNASAVTSADDNDVSDEGLWRHANA